jgi:gluconokinase
MFYVIMGVSGAGKSTIAKLLGDRTGWAVYDADDFHPPANIDKMHRGIALTDGDRFPWLATLQQLITAHLDSDRPGILACSALKAQYRQILGGTSSKVIFVFLQGDYDCIQARIQQRLGHFMSPELLRSQFDTLEVPDDALIINIKLNPEEIVDKILKSASV